MTDSVTDALSDYAEHTTTRFHMPGHKGRGSGTLPFEAALPFDVTELESTDNLYAPAQNGPFRAELDFIRSVYGTGATVLTAGGATAAICAAFACCARKSPGLPVLCDRKAHLSVINALALTGTEPVWFDAGEASQTDTQTLAQKYNGRYSAVFATSPDYYGETRDIAALSALAAELGAPLIVDNSHGAHLFYYNGGDMHPLKLGATLVIDSLHKTLPALTGAALLHARRGFTETELLSALRLFVSTSPSYLISSSACACVRELAELGEAEHASLLELINNARIKLRELGFALNDTYGDPFRLCIYDRNARGLYGHMARGGAVCEFCDGECVVLLTSVRNTTADFELLIKLCAEFTPNPPEYISHSFKFYLPRRALTLREALLSSQHIIPLKDAEGQVAAAPEAPYPPGIPLIVPGEVYDRQVISTLESTGISRCTVCGR